MRTWASLFILLIFLMLHFVTRRWAQSKQLFVSHMWLVVRVFLCPHPRSKRSFSSDGQKRTSVSSTTWFSRPSSPGDLCTSSRWGWRKDRCRCCDPTTPRGRAGRTPPYGSAGSASLDEPVHEQRRWRCDAVFNYLIYDWWDVCFNFCDLNLNPLCQTHVKGTLTCGGLIQSQCLVCLLYTL